jgi:hypothetical protein
MAVQLHSPFYSSIYNTEYNAAAFRRKMNNGDKFLAKYRYVCDLSVVSDISNSVKSLLLFNNFILLSRC